MRPILNILAVLTFGLTLIVVAAAGCASKRSSVPVRSPPQVVR